MSLKKSPKLPTPPDPYKTAAAQDLYSNSNIYGPNGTVTQGYVGENGEFIAGIGAQGTRGATQVMETDFQRTFREGAEGGALGLQEALLGGGINLPDRAQVQDQGQIAQEYYDQNADLISRHFDRDQMRTETRLQNRGLPIGSLAFADGVQPVREAQTNALANLASRATEYAGAEQSRRYGLDANARAAALQEYLTAASGAGNPTPTINAPQRSSVNIAGMIGDNYNSQVQAALAEAQGKRQTFGTLAGLAGAFF